ncbi:MAG: hypothetical protein QOI01_1961 [Mycobacterium sp.]|nr:hypothetical protein [Mycobacterium sp.]
MTENMGDVRAVDPFFRIKERGLAGHAERAMIAVQLARGENHLAATRIRPSWRLSRLPGCVALCVGRDPRGARGLGRVRGRQRPVVQDDRSVGQRLRVSYPGGCAQDKVTAGESISGLPMFGDTFPTRA